MSSQESSSVIMVSGVIRAAERLLAVNGTHIELCPNYEPANS